MVQRRASKSMPAMTSRIREVEGHSRAHRRVPSPRRRSPRREDFQRTSRAPARSSREVSEVLRSRSSGPVCCSRCRSRRSASPVRCPTHRHGRATSPVRCTVHSPTRRHRALEERNSISSTEPILNERHREDEEYSRARRHRVFEREPRAEDEGYHKKTIGSRVCKAAKLVSGFLISMGLVLVVSTDLILFNSPQDRTI
nr:uncharacterized protein LOC128688720 [Cherax quadricarinatus]